MVKAWCEADVEWIRELCSKRIMQMQVGGTGISTVIWSLVSNAFPFRTTEWLAQGVLTTRVAPRWQLASVPFRDGGFSFFLHGL